MAQRVSTAWGTSDSDVRRVINVNAEELVVVGVRVAHLQAVIATQADEILQLRAKLMGIVELLHSRMQFRDLELDEATASALQQLRPPPPVEQSSADPYRGLPTDPTPEVSPLELEARQLLRAAEEHHFAKRFADARAVYQEIVDRYAETETAEVAKQQLDNLRGLDNES